MQPISTQYLARLVAVALAAITSTTAQAEPPPRTHVVEDARVTREVPYDHPVARTHRLCVEGPLPAQGFDGRHVEIHLRRPAPQHLEALLRPVVEPDGRVCTSFLTAVAAEPELTIEIRDVRQFWDQYLYYQGPLLAIPDKRAGR